MAIKGFLLKMRPRMSKRMINSKKISPEIKKLEKVEEKLEDVSLEVMDEIKKIQEIEEKKQKSLKDSSWIKDELKHVKEFSWIKGEFTILLFQDLVGAAFGAVFFVVTQEVWDLSVRLKPFNLFLIFLLSLLFGFSLIYFSRRRKLLSMKLHQTVLLRTVEIYVTSFVASVIFILIFGVSSGINILLFREAIIVALPSVISAATADLLFF